MKRLGQKICVAVALSLAFVAIWHDSAKAATAVVVPVITSLGQIRDSNVANPNRIDVDAAGTIYMSDGSLNAVTRFNKYGKALPPLKGPYKVKSTGVAVTPDGSRVFVAVAAPNEMFPTAVAVIDGSTGALLGYLGAGFNEFKRVVEIDLDSNKNIYVGNYDKPKTVTNLVNTAEIDVYSATTYAKLPSAIGGPATNLVSGYYLPKDGEFGEIAGFTVDVNKSPNEILVAEGWNNSGIARVQIFGIDGTFKRNLPETIIAGPAKVTTLPLNRALSLDPVSGFDGYITPSQVNCKPVSLSVDPFGRVYMLSTLTSTVHVFTTSPEAYWKRFTSGTPDPAFVNNVVVPWGPGMITIPSFDTIFDPLTSRLYVVTDGNGIQIFSTGPESVTPVQVNSAPSTPVMLSPVQESEVATLTPSLQWNAATDADGDVVVYNLKIVDEKGATVSTFENVGTTNVTVAAGVLLENKRYGWQVQASDGVLTSSYGAIENFWVNAVKEAPSVALLESPAYWTTADLNTAFSWQSATDADPRDTVKYRLEISSSENFVSPLITAEQNEVVSAKLSTLNGYAALTPAATYHWRVVAIDGTGLSSVSEIRPFVYISTMVTVNATFPGAKVYLGGNNAYSGRFVGVVPVELRDINSGLLELVVERPGFEPYVTRVTVYDGQRLEVNATLVVAILPGDFKSSSLSAEGLKIQAAADSAPVAVDFDSDGVMDLLVADGSGKLVLYKGVKEGAWQLSTGVQLANLTLPAGAVPFVADWNNDNRKDLMVGAADGSVSLYLNEGTQAVPVFAAAAQLLAGNAPLNVVSGATPLLFDLDNDGDKDLMVGSGDGTLYKFLNIGTDAAPVFAAREVLIAAENGAMNASPVVTDWDADGTKEILLATSQGVVVYTRQPDGSYNKGGNLAFHQSFYNAGAGKYEVSTPNLGEKVRLVVTNVDGIRGKDLLLGNAAGEIVLAESTINKASSISPLYDVALLETVAEIEAKIQANGRSTPVVATMLNQVKLNIQSKAVNKLSYYVKAKKDLVYLQNTLKTDEEISVLLAKLQTQLNSTIPLN